MSSAPAGEVETEAPTAVVAPGDALADLRAARDLLVEVERGAQGVPSAHLLASLGRAAAVAAGSTIAAAGLPGAPVAWVDDLGLRHFDSPRHVLVDGLAEVGLAWPTVDEPGSARSLGATLAGNGQLELLADVLGVLVDDLGAWGTAAMVARGALAAWNDTDVVPAAGALALTRCGNVLGVAGDAACLGAFALVATGAASPVDRALARIRTCVAHVKRLGSGADVVEGAFDAARAAVAQVGGGSGGDHDCLASLLGNLEALAHVRAGDRAQARTTVEAAWQRVAQAPFPPTDELGAQFVDEVRTQVLSNLAVVVGASDGWGEALPLYERGAEIAASSARPALQMETGVLLGYARWKAGDLDGAHAALVAADSAGARVPASTQRAQAWKLLAVVEEDRGNRDAAEGWLQRLQH